MSPWRTCQATYRFAVSAVLWPVGFWRYYTSSRRVVVESLYPLGETKERLLQLNDGRDVYVRIDDRGQLFMNATAHAGNGKGAPVIPGLCAKLDGDSGRAVLVGSIGVPSGMRRFLWFFLATLLACEFLPGKEAFPGAVLMVIGLFLLFMVACYQIGRTDLPLIVQRLTEATGTEPRIV